MPGTKTILIIIKSDKTATNPNHGQKLKKFGMQNINGRLLSADVKNNGKRSPAFATPTVQQINGIGIRD